VLIVPVDGLYLTEAVDREFRVVRVLFVHTDKLPYVRRRFGFEIRVRLGPCPRSEDAS
jgi:hypothetical protein